MRGIILADCRNEHLLPLCKEESLLSLSMFDQPIYHSMTKQLAQIGITEILIFTDKAFSPTQPSETDYSTVHILPSPGFCYSREEIFGTKDSCLVIPELGIMDFSAHTMPIFFPKQTNSPSLWFPDAVKSTEYSNWRKGLVFLPKNVTEKTICFSDIEKFLEEKHAPIHHEAFEFLPVTSPADYIKAARYCLEKPELLGDYKLVNGVITEKNHHIELGAKIKPPVYIGDGVLVEKNAEILPNSIICRGCKVGENAKIDASILMENCKISSHATITGAILAHSVTVSEKASVSEGSVFGSHSRILPTQKEGHVSPLPKKFPLRFLPDGKIPIPKKDAHLFLEKLGKVCAVLFPNGLFLCSKDDSPGAEFYSYSLQIGLKSGGGTVLSLPDCPFFMHRLACFDYRVQMGCYMFSHNEQVFLRLVDENGISISGQQEQKIWNLFSKDYKQSFASPPKTLFLDPYPPQYAQELNRISPPVALYTRLAVSTSSQLMKSYLQKIAICRKITLSETTGSIRLEIDGSGCYFNLYDENNLLLTPRQKEAVIAKLLSEKKVPCYVATIQSSEVVLEHLKRAGVTIKEVSSHNSELERELLRHPQQYHMMQNPVYLTVSLLSYLKRNLTTLSQLTATLPKSFFIEKSVTAGEHLGEAIANLLKLSSGKSAAGQTKYKFRSRKGTTVISAEEDRLKIISESQQEEYAQELTDFYVNQISQKKNLHR